MRKTIVITDPVHQVMNLGSNPSLKQCLKDVIDTRMFQRLRGISQLGLASYVFPGATHTRFSHSLGAAYLAHSVLTHLRERADRKQTCVVLPIWIFHGNADPTARVEELRPALATTRGILPMIAPICSNGYGSNAESSSSPASRR